MSNIVPLNNSQPSGIERITFGMDYAIPVEKGLQVAGEVIEDLGQNLVATVESKISAQMPVEEKIEEVEALIRTATKAPAWAQSKALKRIRDWVGQLQGDVSLQGRVAGLTTELKFMEMATRATERSYGALEDLSDQTVGLLAGSGEIYLDHLVALASALPGLAKAFEVEGDFDRKWALKDAKNILWAIEDEGSDLVKAIAPEVKRAKEEYHRTKEAFERLNLSSFPFEIIDTARHWEEATTHLRLIKRMKVQVDKLKRVADGLNGPLREMGAVLRGQAEAIEQAIGDIGDVYYDPSLLKKTIDHYGLENLSNYVKRHIEKKEEGGFIAFKRAMAPFFSYGGPAPKEVIEILAKEEGLPAEGYDFKAKNTIEMRKSYLFDRKNVKERFKELSSLDGEKSTKWAWLFLGLQALTMLRGAGSLLLGYDAAALKGQAESMQRKLFEKVDPNLKVAIERDGARLGAILSDKWDVLKKMGPGSMQDGLLHKLSHQAKQAIVKLLNDFEKAPSSQQIQRVCDAVMTTRLAEQVPSPFHHLSIGEWLDLFAKSEVEEEVKVAAIGTRILVDKGLLLHVGGREFGKATGLEGYSPVEMLKYVQQQLEEKIPNSKGDREAIETLSSKMKEASVRTNHFNQLSHNEFTKRLNWELARLKLGDNLFWVGGWTSPGMMGGHAIVYEIVRVDEDDYTFRVYNQGAGVSEYHAQGHIQGKMKSLTMHEVVDVKRAMLLRPTVIQGLQEFIHEPKEGRNWDPGELYFNVLGRMNGKISSRQIPIDQMLPNIYVGVCTFSSLAAFMHDQLGGDRLYDRTMIDLEAKATWDYWQQHGSTLAEDREGRELLLRTAKQTIQDALAAAKPDRNSLSNIELDLIRSKMEEIIRGVKGLKRKQDHAVYQVTVQSKASDFALKGDKGSFWMPEKGSQVKEAPKYEGIDFKTAEEAVEVLHQGNLDKRWDLVRSATHSFVQSIPLDGIEIAPEEAAQFVDHLVQIASEFQWSLQHVLTEDKTRSYRLPIKDALVPIKLLTIADSIARRFSDTVGIALPNMLQQQMAVVLYGMTSYSRVDDPALEEDMKRIRSYWNGADPGGEVKGKQIIGYKYKGKSDAGITPSLFGFEWVPAGFYSQYLSECKSGYISEDVKLAQKHKPDKWHGFGAGREWPLIQWTINYLKEHPEKLEPLFKEHPFLKKASPTAVAMAVLMDEYKGSFSDPKNPLKELEIARSGRIQNVLPEMFFHLWDLSFMVNYLFTGGWNSDFFWGYKLDKKDYSFENDTDLMLRQRPIRAARRYVEKTEDGPLYFWAFDYKQYGNPAGDGAQAKGVDLWRSDGATYILPHSTLRKAYGEHDSNLSNAYGKSGYRHRYPPKVRPLLREMGKSYVENYDQNGHFGHAIPDMPRETVQRLLGLSSKEDLQIEETLAYFQSNFPILEKVEYRALLNYMLFEQGLLLDEIKRRNPAELRSLVENIEAITNKGHQYFGELLGKTDIGASFLDIAATTRRYLTYAGKDKALIEDPVPKLRKELKDPALTDRQRTYLRFILAKSSQDPIDIVTSAIQQELHPFDFTPFDDETRRDLPNQFRSEIYRAFTGPNRDFHLNTIVQKETSWKTHGDFPLYQSSDGRITVDVLKGFYYEEGRVPRSLSDEICKNLKREQIVQNPEVLKAIQRPDETWEFTAPSGIRMMATKKDIWREINSQMYQKQHAPNFGNQALVHGNHVWSNDSESIILDIKTGQKLYRVSHEEDRIIVERPNGMVMVRADKESSFGFLTAMEDPTWIRAWADPKSGKLVSIELPRFDLSFKVDNEGKVQCDQLPGYFLSPLQRQSYLLLDRIDRSQNIHQVVAMPLQSFYDAKKKALAPEATVMRELGSPKQRYALYDVNGFSQRLIPRTIEGRFHLAMVHLWNHDYKLAAELIRGFGGQRAPFTSDELKALEAICTLDQHNDDQTPQGRAVRMIASAALVRHHLDFGKDSKFSVKPEDYYLYRHQLEFTPELALTKEEENLIGIKAADSKMNTVNAIIPQALEENERIKEPWKMFFAALTTNDGAQNPSILRSRLDGELFLSIYSAIERQNYRHAYRELTGIELPLKFSNERDELLTALKMVISGRSNEIRKLLAKILVSALLNKNAPTLEQIRKTKAETAYDGWDGRNTMWEKEMKQHALFYEFDLNSVDAHPEFSTSPGVTVHREPIVPRKGPVQEMGYNQGLMSIPHLQGPVIENLDAFITTKPFPANKVVTTALQKIFQVKTGEALADKYLAETVRGIQEYEDTPATHYQLKDLEGLRKQRLELEQEIFLMTNRESIAAAKLLEEANRLPLDPTLRAQSQAALASGNIRPVTFDDLALSFSDFNQETLQLLIQATERQRKQAVVEAIKDLEEANGASPQEISNLIGQLKGASEAVRQFDPALKPAYLVFEYYIGILLQGRQVDALDELLEKVKLGQGIHSKELSNVLEMIMGSGKTAVLAPLIAWLEANGEKLSMIVMPEGLMPEKIQELEQRFGAAFGRSIDVLTFDRDTNFDEKALIRLLERLDEARSLGKLVMVSSSSLQSLFLRFIEDALGQSEPHRLDLFRQVLAKLRTHGSILFDELDAIADVLKLQIFSMAEPGSNGERLPANTELKETTADLLKYMVTDPELSPMIAKPFTPEMHERFVKPRLLEAIMAGRIGDEKSEFNRFLKGLKSPEKSWFFSTPERKQLLRNYLLNKDDSGAFAYVAKLDSLPLKNTLAVFKQQINKMIPETFSKRVDEHYGIIDDPHIDPETKYLSKPLEKGSWELGSEHGTAEEGINYSFQYYLAKGLPLEFVRKEVIELRDLLLAELTAGEIEFAEESTYFATLMRLTGGKRYPLDRIGEAEIEEITHRINGNDPSLIIDLAMKYAVNPQLKIFPYQLRADAHILFLMTMLSRGFSGTVWNWQTFDTCFKNVKLSNTEAKTLHLLQANSPQEVTIVNAQDLDGKLDQLFQGKPSIAVADVGNLFADEKGEDVAKVILEKGAWKGVPYYDENDKLLVALPGRASEPLTTAGVSKENRAPYWKQELCTGSDIPLGTTANAVVTFGRYTMMRDLLQTVWRLRKLDKGQAVRFAVEENDRIVITETLERLTKQKIEKLELSHLLLYAAYIQAMRIADDNHRSLGQQLRAQLIGEVFNVIVQPNVSAEQVIEIIQSTQDLFVTKIDPNPYELYGTRESLTPAKKVVEAELQEILASAPMKALKSHPVLKEHCDAVAIEKRLRETVDKMLPRMASHLNQPLDTGIRLKVKTKTKTQTKTETQTQTQTKTKTQVQLRAAVHKERPQLPVAAMRWTKETLFHPAILKPASAFDARWATIDTLPGNQVTVADALGHYHPIASIFDPRLLTSLNRMPIYTPKDREKQISFVPYDEFEDPVTTHALLIQDKGQIGLMLLDQDDSSDIQVLLKQEKRPAQAPNLALINLVTDKVWRQRGEPINTSDFQGLKAQAKLVNGMLSYTEEEQKALVEFLKGKDVKAIREWFTQIVIGNRQRSLERFPNSDLEKVFQKAMAL